MTKLAVASRSGFHDINNVAYQNEKTGADVLISSETVVSVIADANRYLLALRELFDELDFPIFVALGQRNLSGFIGEVYTHCFANHLPSFRPNPHADGRPDLLDLSSELAETYFEQNCHPKDNNGRQLPIKSPLAPFKFGGIEVKCTIGSPVSKYKQLFQEDTGKHGFEVGDSRVNYLKDIQFWAHHQSCGNLMGLYYDYCPQAGDAPQIMAVLQATLDPTKDWQKVSIGKPGSKKTSNTSLTLSGKRKMFSGCVAVVDDPLYINVLKKVGVQLPKMPVA